MVLEHFKLRAQPFGVTPDPRYLYASASHREALASLLYGISSGLGFVTLTANPGMGKTTILFETLRRLEKTHKTVFLFQNIASTDDLIRALLIDLGIKDIRPNLVEMQTQLNEVLVMYSNQGKQLVVAIDEAQNLSESVLEAVRMLSNFETARHKLLQIILAGQPQLAEKLATPGLLQLRQRISIFGRLDPLSPMETAAYVQHRLRVSGYTATDALFSNAALALIAEHSGGIPRNINNICFNSLSIGCALKRTQIDEKIVREVIHDLNMDLNRDLGTRESRSEPTPAIRAKGNRRFSFLPVRAWAYIAAASVSVLLFGWLLVRAHWATAAAAPTSTSLPVTTTAGLGDSSSTPGKEKGQNSKEIASALHSATASGKPETAQSRPVSTQQIRSVRVREGQSLYGICSEQFRKCSPELMRQVLALNSSIPDPDHIETGQRVLVPVLNSSAR